MRTVTLKVFVFTWIIIPHTTCWGFISFFQFVERKRDLWLSRQVARINACECFHILRSKAGWAAAWKKRRVGEEVLNYSVHLLNYLPLVLYGSLPPTAVHPEHLATIPSLKWAWRCLLLAPGLMVKVREQVGRPHASQTWVGVRGEGALFGQQ